MVDVIERKEWLRQEECTGAGNGGNGCGSLLGLKRSDFRYYSGGGWCERDPEVVFKCPVCGSLTDLEKSKWPQNYTHLKPFTTEWRDGTEIED